ncbi:MAG: FtsX-like permease family protein [Candidatus Kariarchaeaceae archaeon]|jgi:ABC-type lipoprotein release transport system permease subunit
MFALPYALKSILRRKQKNMITTLAIALGVALFIGAQAGSDGIVDTMTKLSLDNIGNIDITITDPTSTNGLFNQSFVDLIDTDNPFLDDIVSISPRIIYSTSVYETDTGLLEEGITVHGIQPGDTGFGEFKTPKGAPIMLEDNLEAGEVIISDLLADELDLKINEEVQFSVPNGLGNSTTKQFIVAEIYDETKGRGKVGASPKGNNPQLYINLGELQSELHQLVNQSISEIALTFDGIDRSVENFDVNGKSFPGKKVIKDAIHILERMFEQTFPVAFVFSSRVNYVETMGVEIASITSFLTLFAIMLNATALLLIVNVQNMAVDDRKNQTAILRAMGSSVRTIFAVFVIEAAIVGIIGAFIGFILGYGISIWLLALISEAFGVSMSGVGLNPTLIIFALIVGTVLSIITAVLPSMRAAKQGIANALRGLEEPKKPRKGFTTLLFGLILLPIGLIFASQVGNVFDTDNWSTYENQTTMLLGFGLTLAGLGMLLTLKLSRRLALSISGASLWGLAAFFIVVGTEYVRTGNPGNWFMVFVMFIVVGGTLLVAVNYEWLMDTISRLLFLIIGLRAISQVTTKQMGGKKTRGILISTILTIILFLIIIISVYTSTMESGGVNIYDRYSDGVDLVVTTDNAFNNTAVRINQSDPSIRNVFAFRRTILPIYLVSPLDPNLDASKDVIFVPIVEVPEEIINPADDWNEDDSLQFFFRTLSDEIADETGHNPNARTTAKEHKNITQDVYEEFFGGNVRTEKVKFGDEEFFEDQKMIISSWAMGFYNLDLINGATIYLQSESGGSIPTYIGASPWLDMMGSTKYPLFGNAILVTPSIAAELPFDVDFPNLFLVRTSNKFGDTKKNEKLADKIEIDLNNLKDNSSFSSINDGNLIGASTAVVKVEIKDYFSSEVALARTFASFATLGFVIGGLGMMIIAVRSVSERKREIGMMRSIGFSRKSVVFGVLIEMITLSAIGLFVGMVNGILFAESVTRSDMGIPPDYPVGLLLAYVFGVLFLGILAGVIPGYRASKVTPSEALRYTG